MPLKWTSLPADITLLIWDFVAQPPFAPVPWYRAEHLASRVPEYDTDTLARLRILQLVSLEWARAARARIYRKLHINPKVASAMPLLQCIATPRGSALDIGVHVRMLGVGCENNHSDHGEALWSAVVNAIPYLPQLHELRVGGIDPNTRPIHDMIQFLAIRGSVHALSIRLSANGHLGDQLLVELGQVQSLSRLALCSAPGLAIMISSAVVVHNVEELAVHLPQIGPACLRGLLGAFTSVRSLVLAFRPVPKNVFFTPLSVPELFGNALARLHTLHFSLFTDSPHEKFLLDLLRLDLSALQTLSIDDWTAVYMGDRIFAVLRDAQLTALRVLMYSSNTRQERFPQSCIDDLLANSCMARLRRIVVRLGCVKLGGTMETKVIPSSKLGAQREVTISFLPLRDGAVSRGSLSVGRCGPGISIRERVRFRVGG